MKNSLQEPVTKLDLINLKQNMMDVFEESEKKHTEYHERILNSLDKVVKELETWREDKIITDKQVEDHEERISALENRN